MSNKAVAFFKEVKLEVKKINWPSKDQTIRYTLIVLGVSFGVALFLGLFDFLFAALLNKFIL